MSNIIMLVKKITYKGNVKNTNNWAERRVHEFIIILVIFIQQIPKLFK